MIAAAVARASGAYPIIVADVDSNRLEFAKEFAPHCETFLTSPRAESQGITSQVIETIKSHSGEQLRVVFECTGVQSSVITAAYLPRARGEVMAVGVGRPTMDLLPFMHMSLAEVCLRMKT